MQRYQKLRCNLQEYSFLLHYDFPLASHSLLMSQQRRKVEYYQLGGLALGASFLFSCRRYKAVIREKPITQALFDLAVMVGLFGGATAVGVD